MNANYKYWMEKAPANVVEEIKDYTPEQIENSFGTEMAFGTAGIRGPIKWGSNEINEYVIGKAAYGFGKWLLETYGEKAKANGVVIGHDNRRNRVLFSETVASILGAMGIPSVFAPENELQPTPFISYVINKFDYVGGAILTASHNPAADNGFKVYDHIGKQLLPNDTSRVQELSVQLKNIFEVEKDLTLNTEMDPKIFDGYIDAIMEEIPLIENKNRKDMKVTFTAQHGTATPAAVALAKRMNISMKLVEEQCKPDENFTHTKNPNPQHPDAFIMAIEQAEKDGSEFIFSTDPDADRFGLMVKHQGEWVTISGNELPVIQLHYIIEQLQKNGGIREGDFATRSLVSSRFGDKVAAKYGVTIYETLIGFKWLTDKLLNEYRKNKRSLIAWEEANGSAISPTIAHDKDAFQAFVQVIELGYELKLQGKTIVDKLNELYAEFGNFKMFQEQKRFEGAQGIKDMEAFIDSYRELKVGDSVNGLVITEVRDFLKGYKDYRKENILLIQFDGDHQIILRPSGTEPILRIYFDCIDVNEQEFANKILSK